MKYILTLLIGKKAQGEKVGTPSPLPPERSYTYEELNNWMQEVKFGNRYGHRGSFYQR